MYYLYEHRKPTGEVFYVGKGTGRRAFSMSKRSLKWADVVEECNGICIEIVEWYEDEQDAFDAEEKLIAKHKNAGATLVNHTSGGKGIKDYKQTEESRAKRAEALRGYKHDIVTCPHCKKVGGETSMKRWHFDNCSGLRPKHKSRITVFGTRYSLGKYHTKQEAKEVADEFKEFVLSEANELRTIV